MLPCDADDEHHDAKTVSCMTKFHKVKEVDGFMAFDREGEHRYELASIAKNDKRETRGTEGPLTWQAVDGSHSDDL